MPPTALAHRGLAPLTRRQALGWPALIAWALLLPQALHGEVDYLRDIKPLFKARCYACHGALKQKGQLRLDTVAAMHHGGEDGDVITPDKKLLLERVTNPDEKERMPPEGARLSVEEISRIETWLASGAKGPGDEHPEPDPRQHWAYQSPKRAGADIDTLRLTHLRAKGLQPQGEVAPELWLRRVYLDLIGIPPTPEEIRAFQQAVGRDAALARAQMVDRLLASPLYGERWARHFMDIWRYCDWYGLGKQLRHSQKHLWHWRDWIIESLNADQGYDRMIIEMLAADEETPNDPAALRATGFLCRSYYLFNRTTWLDDVIEHTNRAFLGVTMQCVKCHDHKYDPIEQTDYYRMRAIFEPYHVRLDAVPGVTDLEKDGLPRAYDLHLEQATYRHVRGDDKNEDKSRVMPPGVPAVLAFEEIKPVAIPLPEKSVQGSLKALEGPDENPKLAAKHYPISSTGRRLAFARWIVDARNPLTARVLVNHLWLRHFGASLVPDVSDFGRRCPAPMYQDVLDTLAVDFMEHGWSLKRLHRQMVLSELYRTSSSNAGADAATLAADPDNACYWRMNPRRLESQAVRDALLSIAGKLDLRQGGPSITAANESSPRRALYFVQNADEEQRFLGALDNANVLECYRRQESIVPQQALALTNSKLTRDCADALAARMSTLDESQFVNEAFLTLLNRVPNRQESRACLESLQALTGVQTPKPGSGLPHARALFLQALMNHNDFVTLR